MRHILLIHLVAIIALAACSKSAPTAPTPNKAPATVPDNDLDPDREGIQDEADAAGKMSFLDHLDELRRRLVWCMATLFVCVGVMLPFKSDVTKIYLRPYAIMWAQAYDDWLAKLDKEFEDGMGPTDPKAREAAAEFFTKTTR